MASLWSDAPLLDLIHLLARSPVLDISDLVRFSIVCKSWRSVLEETNWFQRNYGPQLEALSVSPIQLPKIMLPEATDDSNGDTRHFFDLATGKAFHLPLPEAKNRNICGSNNGWVVTFGDDMEIHLLNPITRQQIQLPSQLSFNDFGRCSLTAERITNERVHRLLHRRGVRDIFIDKAIIVGSPSSPLGCTVAAIIIPSDCSRLAVVRPGVDKFWTVLNCYNGIPTDIMHHEGRLYAITVYFKSFRLYVWDINNITQGILQDMKMVFMPDPHPLPSRTYGCKFYLLEVLGKILAVGRGRVRDYTIHDYELDVNHERTAYTDKVFVLKYENENWVYMKDLGDCCLVLGRNTSKVLSPVPSGFGKNCIYFTDDSCLYKGRDMGVYSLNEGTYTQFYNGDFVSSTFSPSLWVTFDFNKAK